MLQFWNYVEVVKFCILAFCHEIMSLDTFIFTVAELLLPLIKLSLVQWQEEEGRMNLLTVDIAYVVSLYPLNMATTVIVKNNGRKNVILSSAILASSPSEVMKPESPRLFDFDFEPEEKPWSWKVQDEPSPSQF
ncbi:hypothetical protein SADUNF_Sadunf13G0049000 [Salix dunnii]|uniref:Uncharacterized protein n=1 Tax=Salix dunnii TaxID=1413687 RepID=A0A835MKT7_9ROSI|nr:hypothetical protein SADUNF_Sadunf13G0049000 [Salix dunnii]